MEGKKGENSRRESSCASPAFTAAVACSELVAADPEPARGLAVRSPRAASGGVPARPAVLMLEVEVEVLEVECVGVEGGAGEVRPGGIAACGGGCGSVQKSVSSTYLLCLYRLSVVPQYPSARSVITQPFAHKPVRTVRKSGTARNTGSLGLEGKETQV